MTREQVDRIINKLEAQFMGPEFLAGEWIAIDGDHGTTYVPAEDVPEGLLVVDEEGEIDPEPFAEYYEGRPESIERRTGVGARLSAPGYLDRTDWTVYPTMAEARAGLAEEYGA